MIIPWEQKFSQKSMQSHISKYSTDQHRYTVYTVHLHVAVLMFPDHGIILYTKQQNFSLVQI